MGTAVATWLALILLAGAGRKAWRVDQAAAALQTYGVSSRALQRPLAGALIALELGLAGALLAGVEGAAAGAAAVFTSFGLATSGALLAGRRGRPCACFGGASRLGPGSPLLAAALAACAAALALGWLPAAPAGYTRWLTLALSLTIAAVAALTVCLLALAREIGVLRLQAAGRGALEIEGEGPALGVPQPWAEPIPREGRTLLLLAIFSSDGCPLCRSLAPAVRHTAADPLVSVAIFDEHADAFIWQSAKIPGSPYAVALDLEGTALAKGTFNSLGQLESILATARARERGISLAA
jgi:hypothetical protein